MSYYMHELLDFQACFDGVEVTNMEILNILCMIDI